MQFTFNNQLYALQDLLIISIIYIVVVVVFYLHFDVRSFKVLSILLSGLYFLIFCLPVLILHFNYLNEGVKAVSIGDSKILLKKEIIVSDQIESISIYATYQHFYGSWGISLPYNDYYYYVYIKLKDGNVFFLNSLLGYKLDRYLIENFPNVKINKNISIYPYI